MTAHASGEQHAFTAGSPDFAIARAGADGSEEPFLLAGSEVYSLRPLTPDITGTWLGNGGIGVAREALAAGLLPKADISGLRRGAPIATPGKIVCVGLNYRDHAEETGATLPDEPVIFMKDPMTIGGPFDDVPIPRASSKTDWEVELGVVIGRTARYINSTSNALDHIAGYVLSNDVSEREFQLERGGQWDKGKSCEGFNPLGPWLLPADCVADPQDLRLHLEVNGVARQDGSTSNMLFGVAHIIWYLSQFMVLRPGDLINTGTPAGVALGLPGTPYLRHGDEVTLSIAGLGAARQRFVSFDAPSVTAAVGGS